MSATTIRERPILMSAPMVNAIREKRKWMTRRLVKLLDFKPDESLNYDWRWRGRRGLWNSYATADLLANYCPYGRVGEKLWVRETWALVLLSTDPETGHVDDVTEWEGPLPKSRPPGWTIWYAADCDDIRQHRDDRWVKRWRPSIFMPRWASRITLEIAEVRVERLNDISEADAIAEGFAESFGHSSTCDNKFCVLALGMDDCDGEITTARDEFATLWESLHGKDSWSANPWVWAITFREVGK